MNHEGSKRFYPSGSHIYTTSQRVSHLQASHSRSTPLLIKFFSIPSRSYSCTYTSRIEHASIVEKGRDSDREKGEGQGQPKVRASPEKVEKEAKKAKGTSHLEKFEARALDGHHKDYILLLFVGLARKRTLC